MQFQSYPALLICLFFTGCASTPQTHTLLDDSSFVPHQHEILNVPFVEQSENSCGPATLSMISSFSGLKATPEELAPMMVTTGKNGTLQIDYLGAARRVGLIAVTITTLRDLLTEVSHDHPVVVLQNLGSSANPLWHYSVVHGYDLPRELLLLHSGRNQNLRVDLAQFERTWKGAEYWALVLLRPGKLPETASAQDVLFAASALERVAKNHEANLAYQSILKRWPGTAGAWFGLGNTFAAEQKYQEAAHAFTEALKIEPESGAIRNNLREVNLKLKKPQKSMHK